MTTKEQEKQALEKIRKIVESMGEYSYIGMAMVGVLEDAERNIEDDAAYSMKQRYESAEKRAIDLAEKLSNQTAEIAKLHEEIKMYRAKIRGMEEAAPKETYRKLPKQCIEMVLKHLIEKEETITDGLGTVADQMASYSLGLYGSESDDIKEGYKERLKEQALKHRQLKEDLAEVLETERHFQAYLKTL